jgi:hypothetical protein
LYGFILENYGPQLAVYNLTKGKEKKREREGEEEKHIRGPKSVLIRGLSARVKEK